MGNSKPKIKIMKNGPLIVSGLEKFTNSRNENIRGKKVLSLCRCCASKKKPFCDGTHVSIGFSDEKNENRIPDKQESYQGKKINSGAQLSTAR